MDSVPKILLVDDEERFAKSLQIILSHYDYQCTVAYSGAEAIRLLKENNYSIALLDVNLPDMSGCDILDFVNASRIKTTSIMLTGISTVETAVQAMKHGAYDFLNKPVNHELLIKTIDNAFQHHNLIWELAASEKRFEVLAEASLEGVVVHHNGKLIEANNQFFSMFGYAKEELAEGIFVDKLLTPSSLQIVKQHIENSFFGRYELSGVKKDRTEFPLEVNSRQINYLEHPARVCTIRDLTDRVKAEEEKLELQRKLAKANKLKALGLMAGSVAHDLNNILSGVVSYPEILLAQMSPDDKLYSGIKRVQEAGKRAAAVVADLVLLARGGSYSATVENLNDILSIHLNSIEHNDQRAKYPNVVIQTDIQHSLYNTHCSLQHIHKIFLNLIGNAFEAVHENGLIRITTENCKFTHPESLNQTSTSGTDYVKLTISDNGPGIPQDDLDRIFDPFYSTKKMGRSGTGLGLSIVWNTVQQHNGWIEVKDNNPGAIFEMYLPATTEHISSTQVENIIRPLKGNGEKILLIDDQPEQNEILGSLLSKLGYITYSATSGEDGIKFLQSEDVHVVLLDMIMGDGLNGRETYEKILKIRPGQKAIIISGYSKNEEIAKAKDLGISFCLQKPVTMPILSVAIRQALCGK